MAKQLKECIINSNKFEDLEDFNESEQEQQLTSDSDDTKDNGVIYSTYYQETESSALCNGGKIFDNSAAINDSEIKLRIKRP